MVFNTRAKVIAGFFLTVLLIVSVSAITYFSVKKLLETVESLAEPSEKQRLLNNLLADVYQLDKMKGVLPDVNDSIVDISYLDQIENHIRELQAKTTDSTEISKLERINYDVNELVVVYNGLEEVKRNLLNSNFSNEALKNIERKIRRTEATSELRNLGRLRLGSNSGRPGSVIDSILKDSLVKKTPTRNGLSEQERKDMRELLGLLSINLSKNDTMNLQGRSSPSDSILYVVRNFIMDINIEEQQLRSRLAAFETELTRKNQELIFNIQDIITNLQNEVILKSKAQNESAYALTFKLSILLGFLIIIGIIGSSAFIYSIIKEINKAQDYRDQLEEAKMRSDNLAKAKQDFLANMSHEIRNPLHVIQGYNTALQKTELSRDQQEFVKMVEFASGTLYGIVNDILDFSKMEAGKIRIENRAFHPKKLFLTIQKFFEIKANEKKIDFLWEIKIPDNLWLEGDQLRINQILNNLLSNALKFTENGFVMVKIEIVEEKILKMMVEDSGMGMSKEVLYNIFTEFNQGDASITRRFGGTGLGLSIVKKLIGLLDGEIDIQSEEGEGTTVSISIPTKIVEENLVLEEFDSENYNLEGLHILLVDDDTIGLKFAELLLKSIGAKVTTYNGGIELRDSFEEENFDLALLDIQMPEVSGYDVLQLLRQEEKYKNLPVIAITANVFAKEKQKLEEVGFNGLILKPFKESDLISKIAEVLNIEAKTQQENKEDEMNMEKKHDAGTSSSYDLTDIRKFCMGDKELMEEVLRDFYTETTTDILKLNQLADQKDYEAIREIAHKLGSRLGQLKIATSLVARKLEKELKTNHTDNVKDLIWQITREMDPVLEELMGNLEEKVIDG